MRARPMPPLGPYPSVGGVCEIPVWQPGAETYTTARVDVVDYGLAMARRWREDSNGYPMTYVWDADAKKTHMVYLHRAIARATNAHQVDHINYDLLDCRRVALRLATPSQNSAHRRSLSILPRKLVPFRGVTVHKQTGRYQAAAKYRDRCIYLGLFDSAVEAARAYDAKARELWGKFAICNFAEEVMSVRRAA